MKTQRQIALEAAEVIKEIGWCQGSFREWNHESNSIIGCCAVGAIRTAVGLYSKELNEEDAVELYAEAAAAAGTVIRGIEALIPKVLPNEYGNWSDSLGSPLVHYNDSKDRTREEVIALFEKVAPLLPNTEAVNAQNQEA